MGDLVTALLREIEIRKDYLSGNYLKTIYFGGGTPSLLSATQLNSIFEQIEKFYTIDEDAEITLEANPDDLTPEYLEELRSTKVNRLSIGVQSFFDEDLILMNRAHDSEMALNSIQNAAAAGFDNLTIDLIYGVPGMTEERWRANMEKAFSLPVNHLSCYSLTVERKTVLDKMIREGKIGSPDDALSARHFEILMEAAVRNGFEHYEISNFAKPGYYSRHNSSYWTGDHYIGIGPSAHSFNGVSRQWNIASNAVYILNVLKGEVPAEQEVLTTANQYNEYIMTGLRTIWGVDVKYIDETFGSSFTSDFLIQVSKYLETGDIQKDDTVYRLTTSGKLLADRITAAIFV